MGRRLPGDLQRDSWSFRLHEDRQNMSNEGKHGSFFTSGEDDIKLFIGGRHFYYWRP